MKTIVLLILFSTGFICCFGQNDFSVKPFQKIEFSTLNKTDNNYLLELNPKFKPDTIHLQYDDANWDGNKNPMTELEQERIFASQDDMPIAKPSSMNWNMPIAVPDTSVHYFIKNPMKVEPVPLVIKK